MKVYNLIWSDIFDDDTDITICDFIGKRLTPDTNITYRFYEDVERWGRAEVYGFSYFPSTNSLYIILCGVVKEVE